VGHRSRSFFVPVVNVSINMSKCKPWVELTFAHYAHREAPRELILMINIDRCSDR